MPASQRVSCTSSHDFSHSFTPQAQAYHAAPVVEAKKRRVRRLGRGAFPRKANTSRCQPPRRFRWRTNGRITISFHCAVRNVSCISHVISTYTLLDEMPDTYLAQPESPIRMKSRKHILFRHPTNRLTRLIQRHPLKNGVLHLQNTLKTFGK